MISPIHAFAASAASATEAVLRIPQQVGTSFEGEDPLAADLPPRVREALSSIPDPQERYLLTLVAHGDLVPAGVPAGMPGPDLSKGAAGVTDYLAQLLQTLREVQQNFDAQELAGVDEDTVSESIAQIETLLSRIDPNHPALQGARSSGADSTRGGALDLLA